MLVSVEHGHERMTLSVPDDIPVESLLPLLVDACGADASATWRLLTRDSPPLNARLSLREAGVWPGAVLTLRMADPWWRVADGVPKLERAIAAAGARGVVIAVVPLRSGGGATTVAALLALLLASALPSPPMVVDGDLTGRALSRHLAPRFVLDPERYAELVEGRLRMGVLADNLQGPYDGALLPAPEGRVLDIDATTCVGALARLRAETNVVLLDCPAGLTSPWGHAAWAAADQFVLVVDDPAEAAPVLERLAGATVGLVVSRVRMAHNRDAERPAMPVVALADDPVAARRLLAGQLTWEAAPGRWRRAIARLTAALSSRWP